MLEKVEIYREYAVELENILGEQNARYIAQAQQLGANNHFNASHLQIAHRIAKTLPSGYGEFFADSFLFDLGWITGFSAGYSAACGDSLSRRISSKP